MGYYVCVRVSSKAVRERVHRFFRDNPPLLPEMWPPVPGGDVCAYAHGHDIGYYYMSSAEERPFIYGLLRWLTLQVGPSTSFRSKEVPYYLYEGEPRLVVRASMFPDIGDGWGQPFDLVDDVGFMPSVGVSAEEAATWEPSMYKDRAMAAFAVDAKIRHELVRLDALWRATI